MILPRPSFGKVGIWGNRDDDVWLSSLLDAPNVIGDDYALMLRSSSLVGVLFVSLVGLALSLGCGDGAAGGHGGAPGGKSGAAGGAGVSGLGGAAGRGGAPGTGGAMGGASGTGGANGGAPGTGGANGGAPGTGGGT